MSNTNFPDSAVVYILADIPGQGEFQGTGVIIGPHSILTAAHLVYDADVGATADAVSLYPGYTPGATTYNPAGALGGLQSIHTIKVADNDEQLSASATQSDFAVINTSADLSSYGRLALDPTFTSGYVAVNGYPVSNGRHLTETGGLVHQDGGLSDIGTGGLPLSQGYSGGPLTRTVERNGVAVDAVVGMVSTGLDAMKLTRAKIALIRHWIAADRSLYFGGQNAPRGLVPQIAGTSSGSVEANAASDRSVLAAPVPSRFVYAASAESGEGASHPHHGPVHRPTMAPSRFADIVDALQRPAGGDASVAAPVSTEAGLGTVAPAHGPAAHHRWITGDA